MTRQINKPKYKEIIRIVIFPFGAFETEELQSVADSIISEKESKTLKKSGSRTRSYFAGRCVISYLLENFDYGSYIFPNPEFGYLEVYDAKGCKKKNIFLNLSHTAEIAVGVISNKTIGTDIESLTRKASGVMKRIASVKELEWLHDKSQIIIQGKVIPKDIFLWSAKEAFSKAFGLGMRFGLQGFEILKNTEPPFLGQSVIVGPLKLFAPAISIELYENFLISVCTEKKSILAGINRRVLGRTEFESLRHKLESRK